MKHSFGVVEFIILLAQPVQPVLRSLLGVFFFFTKMYVQNMHRIELFVPIKFIYAAQHHNNRKLRTMLYKTLYESLCEVTLLASRCA